MPPAMKRAGKVYQTIAFMCPCGVGQKGDDGSKQPPEPEWDGKTFLNVAEGEEPKCPNAANHHLLEKK